jgi:hypothetical protein
LNAPPDGGVERAVHRTVRAIAVVALALLAGGFLLREVPAMVERRLGGASEVDLPALAFDVEEDPQVVLFDLGQEAPRELRRTQREVVADLFVTAGYWAVFALLAVLLVRSDLPLGRLLGPIAIVSATVAAVTDVREAARVWGLLGAMRAARDVAPMVPAVLAAMRTKWAMLSTAAGAVGVPFVLRGTDALLVTGATLLTAAAMGGLALVIPAWPGFAVACVLLVVGVGLLGGTCLLAPDELVGSRTPS